VEGGERVSKDEARRLGDQYDHLKRGAFMFRRKGGMAVGVKRRVSNPNAMFIIPLRMLMFYAFPAEPDARSA